MKLWISITDDLSVISETFMDYHTRGGISSKMIDKHQAFIQVAERMSDGVIGILIVFRSKEYCDTKTIAHESTHASRFIWEHLGELITGIEADAYLVGWIADCCQKAKSHKQ